jgi:hypothetical protein
MERKYTANEITRMRAAVHSMIGPREANDGEERLRTYMMNATDPAELEAEALRIQNERAVDSWQGWTGTAKRPWEVEIVPLTGGWVG